MKPVKDMKDWELIGVLLAIGIAACFLYQILTRLLL